MTEQRFHVTGMSCAACSARVERAVRDLGDTGPCAVNLLQHSLNVDLPEGYDIERLKNAIEAAGYGLKTENADTPRRVRQQDRDRLINEDLAARQQSLWISFACLLPLMWIAMGPMMGLPLPLLFSGEDGLLLAAWAQVLLLLPILWCFKGVFANGFKTLYHGAPTMDALVALGAGASILSGLIAMGSVMLEAVPAHTLAHSLYFEGAGMILTLVSLGKFFEARAKKSTTEAVDALTALSPETATVDRNGLVLSIPLEALQSGDTVLLKAGDRVPSDGVALEGTVHVDESLLTGESRPVKRMTGDTLTGGTLVLNGHLRMRATRVGDDTVLARIVDMVDRAGAQKAPVARLADRVSGFFVPVVIAIALLTTLLWWLSGADIRFAVGAGIAVLVISCPCALGLATPTAIMVGTGRAARLGLLFKSAPALEQLANAKTVVFDKTGTLTWGVPVVEAAHLNLDGKDANAIMVAIAQLESHSSHPLAGAIVAWAQGLVTNDVVVRLTDYEDVDGEGVRAHVSPVGKLAIGNVHMMKRAGATIPLTVLETAQRAQAEGAGVVYVSLNQEVLGWCRLADTPRAGAKEAVEALKAAGLRVMMVTGDNVNTAQALAKRLGIDKADVLAGVKPEQKAKTIESLKPSGLTVMVGDGVNDAPALATADVGMAVGGGTDVAAGTADVVLLYADPADVVRAIQLAQATMRNIRQNLGWAFLYNLIGIPVAAGVFYPWTGWMLSPMIAAAAMSLSSVSVVSNALRLRGMTPRFTLGSDVVARQHEEAAHVEVVRQRQAALKAKFEAATEALQPRARFSLRVDGMMCGHCTGTVTKVMTSFEGVDDVEVSLEPLRATFTAPFDSNTAPWVEAIEAKLFKVTGIYRADVKADVSTEDFPGDSLPLPTPVSEALIEVSGMNCQHCVKALTKALLSVEGVRDTAVDLETQTAAIQIEGDIDEAMEAKLKAAVEGVHFAWLAIRH